MRPSNSWLALAVGLALGLQSGDAQATEPTEAPDLVFVADPALGMEGTVRSFMSIGRVLRRYEDHVPEIRSPAVLCVGERLVRFVFLDVPLATLETTVIHEVAGHGARAREWGQYPSYQFTLPSPYLELFSPSDPGRAMTVGTTAPRGVDADLALRLGGIESEYLTAYWTNLGLVASGGQLHMMDAIVYSSAKISYFGSFLGADGRAANAAQGDDVHNHVAGLADRFNRFTPAERSAIAERLQIAYLWNFADPTLFWSLGVSLYQGIGRGRRVTTMPLPTIGHHYAYLLPRFGLTPFGAEHYVDAFVAPERALDGRRWVGTAYVRAGSSGLASYVGAGAKLLDVSLGTRLRVGGELDVWRQPVIDVNAVNYYERPSSFGLNGAAFAAVSIIGPLSITGKLGYKSTGFVTGLPLGDGPHGYIGIALRP